MAIGCDYCGTAAATRDVTSANRKHRRFVCDLHEPAALNQLGHGAVSEPMTPATATAGTTTHQTGAPR